MANENGRRRDPFLKIAAEFLVLVIGLGVCAIFLQHKITNLLNLTMEQIVARQTSDMANLAEEQFRRELTVLHHAANYITANPDRIQAILQEIDNKSEEGDNAGVVTVNGDFVLGAKLPANDFLRLPWAVRGYDVVDFSYGKGLLLAVPIVSGDNVRGILWRLYDDKLVRENFGLSKYNSDRHFIITAHDGQTILPYKKNPDENEMVFSDPSIQEGFEKIREQLATAPSAALYTESAQGRFFLFGADLPEANCSLRGFVSWEAVAGGISRIYVLILRAGGILLFLLALISVYLFIVQAKAEESDSLRREKEFSDRASQAKSAFLANMSHEIRTPINAILGMNEMILREEGKPSIREYAQSISRAGEALLSIINDILDFSKIESGKLEIVESEYQLSRLLKNVVAMIQPKADAKGLEFHLHIDEDLPDALMGDMMRVQQVVINILTNAVKYTPMGEINFYVFNERKEDNRIYLSFVVNDTGIGIKEEDQKKLFRDFERLDQEKNRNIEGTGLGLAITHMLLDLMGGTISLHSVYGEGSTFTVVLPQTVMEDSPIGNLAERMSETTVHSEQYVPSFTAPDAKILVVDDNEMNLLVVTGLLKETKMRIDTCMSGPECLERLADEKYDVILLDHMMPSMDGVETLHHAENLPNAKDTPFIMLTANAVSGAKDAFLKEGFSAYLSKPIDSMLMEATLMKYLPQDKLRPGPTADELSPAKQAEGHPSERAENRDAQGRSTGDLDIEQGMKYNGGMEDMYRTVLGMFINLRPEKQRQMKEHLDAEDWQNYATMLHALKSTSMTIGGQKCSDAAKALELAGKRCFAEGSSDDEKQEAAWYIRSHHERAMALYDKLAQDAERWLKQK
ncbi:MAG: response regulator [Schwartzia sp.]|nr:response regulator [Schwartzia sp. (in: firmicutes)]